MSLLDTPLDAQHDATFSASILAGLTAPRKSIESKWFYDPAGSRLFDQITGLAEYYPTRTEHAILEDRAADLAPMVFGDTVLAEFGSGSSVKTRHLLDHLPGLSTYVPIDISAKHLEETAERLRRDYPNLTVLPVAGDFTGSVSLPERIEGAPVLVFFPGSTIGNFNPDGAVELMARWRAIPNVAGLIIGVDLKKDPSVLVPAYDDAQGVTAAFNLNLLHRINRELGADLPVDRFGHEARWNEADSRIEMHLVSLEALEITICGQAIAFGAGETIHTENSYKYDPAAFTDLAHRAGWRVSDVWMDDGNLFSVQVLTPE